MNYNGLLQTIQQVSNQRKPQGFVLSSLRDTWIVQRALSVRNPNSSQPRANRFEAYFPRPVAMVISVENRILRSNAKHMRLT
jgi:hypothetical protein